MQHLSVFFAVEVSNSLKLACNEESKNAASGYKTRKTDNKLALYADDIILFISEPNVSIPNILNLINSYGIFEGYKINWEKNVLMPVAIKDSSWLYHLPFKIGSELFTYLGIEVTKNFSNLVKSNYQPLSPKLKSMVKFPSG